MLFIKGKESLIYEQSFNFSNMDKISFITEVFLLMVAIIFSLFLIQSYISIFFIGVFCLIFFFKFNFYWINSILFEIIDNQDSISNQSKKILHIENLMNSVLLIMSHIDGDQVISYINKIKKISKNSEYINEIHKIIKAILQDNIFNNSNNIYVESTIENFNNIINYIYLVDEELVSRKLLILNSNEKKQQLLNDNFFISNLYNTMYEIFYKFYPNYEIPDYKWITNDIGIKIDNIRKTNNNTYFINMNDKKMVVHYNDNVLKYIHILDKTNRYKFYFSENNLIFNKNDNYKFYLLQSDCVCSFVFSEELIIIFLEILLSPFIYYENENLLIVNETISLENISINISSNNIILKYNDQIITINNNDFFIIS